MDKRVVLQPDTKLDFYNISGERVQFIVEDVVGLGGTCIVYNGHYINNSGKNVKVLIKECYPYRLHIKREQNGFLTIDSSENKQFIECQARVRSSFDVSNKLHNTSGLTNVTSNFHNIYEQNNTVYIVSSYVEGGSLYNAGINTLSDANRIAISIAKCIEKIHSMGYLYLDLKPDNIFIYKETVDMIQLFDFDSMIPVDGVEKLEEYRLSYSTGFAPVEQKMADVMNIGKHTDIYSLGAILFWLLYGRIYKSAEIGMDFKWDDIILQKGTRFQPKVYKGLEEFFENTLKPYSGDRYQDMAQAEIQLENIKKYIDIPVPFICSSYIEKDNRIIGRNKEVLRLENWYKGDEPLICVTGMGGIGKSTVVRKFISVKEELFENVVYLNYRDSLQETLIDDDMFHINFCFKYNEENDDEYCIKKLETAGKIASEESTLLVLDNYTGNLSEDVDILLKVKWKIIIVTRKNVDNCNYPIENIHPFKNRTDSYAIVEMNMGRHLSENEYQILDRIIESVDGHTLILVLIAKQVSRSYIGLDETLALINESGFSEMTEEKIRYVKDGNLFYDKVSKLIMSIYDVAELSDEMKDFMKAIALFGEFNIDVKIFKGIFELKNFNRINELADQGWIDIDEQETKVKMHPLIQETVRHIGWNRRSREFAGKIMMYLEECISSMHRNLHMINMAKTVLKNCENDTILVSDRRYDRLLFQAIMKSSRQQEDYIISYSQTLFKDRCIEPQKLMQLYDYVVFILCQKKMYDTAYEYITQARTYAKNKRNHYMWGLYYELLSSYLNDVLDGEYDVDNENSRLVLRYMLQSLERAIHHLKKSDEPEAKVLYVKEIIGEAGFLIRSTPENHSYIRNLLLRGKENLIDDYEIRSTYYMTCAWYYTLCEPEKALAEKYIKKAERIMDLDDAFSLDNIEYFFIPAANMMLEFFDVKEAEKLLMMAIEICDKYENVAPFIRIKQDLQNYLKQVWEVEYMLR